jgi:hypothetical protein
MITHTNPTWQGHVRYGTVALTGPHRTSALKFWGLDIL